MAKTSPSINCPNFRSANLETNSAFFSDKTSFRVSGFTSKNATFKVLLTKD